MGHVTRVTMDRRKGSSRHGVVAVAAICAFGACLCFADGNVMSQSIRRSARGNPLTARSAVKFVSRKKAKYAPIDVNQLLGSSGGVFFGQRNALRILGFYLDTVGGDGGPPKGLERDLITKCFGNGDFHGRGDHEAAFQTFKECMQNGEPFEGSDDGSGWIWAVADLTVDGGLQMELRKSTPLGMRALMVARTGNTGEMFESLNWPTVRRRFNEILGHRDAEGVEVPGFEPA
ncbi:unnamed protein product [Symbiodinium natans]|uniref:Uncharacterized protein n=1 Tax=Symbiodinium natans TaxID=878477 RepID=A0A812JQL6_9DINO|nr:unnamed protein product [Symbiodinium natans]